MRTYTLSYSSITHTHTQTHIHDFNQNTEENNTIRLIPSVLTSPKYINRLSSQERAEFTSFKVSYTFHSHLISITCFLLCDTLCPSLIARLPPWLHEDIKPASTHHSLPKIPIFCSPNVPSYSHSQPERKTRRNNFDINTDMYMYTCIRSSTLHCTRE